VSRFAEGRFLDSRRFPYQRIAKSLWGQKHRADKKGTEEFLRGPKSRPSRDRELENTRRQLSPPDGAMRFRGRDCCNVAVLGILTRKAVRGRSRGLCGEGVL